MRKALLLLTISLPLAGLYAQEPADALKFSWYVPGGSARTQAVGGAMGSLGGDLTALFVNPAGLAFYKTGDVVFSPAYQSGNSRSRFIGMETKDEHSRFTIGTSGLVSGTGNNKKQPHKNLAWAIALNRTMDFNSAYGYMGQNFNSSYSQKYLAEINGIKDANFVAGGYPYGASQAFNTYWIDTVGGGTPGNHQFQSRSLPLLSQGLLQSNFVETRGGVTELAIGGGAQTSEKFMFGGTLSIPIVYYEKDVQFVEADPTSNPNNKFDDAIVEENLETRGYGFNLKAGLIYKPVEYWRLGLAVHSPTFYSLKDKYSVTVTTNTEAYQGTQFMSTEDIVDPAKFEYFYSNPYRVIGSISYVIREIENVTRQRGFITADVEYVNHKASKFFTGEGNDGGNEAYFNEVNKAIDAAYKSAFNFRLGGELKFTTIMVRLGAAFYGNPYQDIQGEYGQKLNFSGGLGYRDKGFFIDLTYVHAKTQDVSFAYRLEGVQNDMARVKSTVHNVLLTAGLKF